MVAGIYYWLILILADIGVCHQGIYYKTMEAYPKYARACIVKLSTFPKSSFLASWKKFFKSNPWNAHDLFSILLLDEHLSSKTCPCIMYWLKNWKCSSFCWASLLLFSIYHKKMWSLFHPNSMLFVIKE